MHDQTRWRSLRWIALAATIGMFVVLLMGSTVTNTGSAEGCGRSWPLCHGKWAPMLTKESLIEFGHRAVTGVEGVLIAVTAYGAWRTWWHRREVRVLVWAMLFFLILQAGLGAWAVLQPQTPQVMAAHFGVSLTAFASVFLLTVFLFEVPNREAVRDRPVPANLRRLIWGSIVFIYGVVYLGAYVRHTNANLACLDWPLCQGQVFPGFSGPVGTVFIHRLAALAGTLLIIGLVVWAYRLRSVRPDLYHGAVAALVLIVLQSLSGAVIVYSRMAFYSTLLHAGLVTLLFGAMSYLCYQTLPRPAEALVPIPATERAPSGVLEPGEQAG